MASSNAAAESELAVFSYFDGRGHGERVRYALAAADVPYRENLLRRPGDVDAVRPRCAYGQVPLLEMPRGGPRVVQSYAIVRFLGASYGPRPPAGAEHKADAALEQVRDFVNDAGLVGYGWQSSAEEKAAALERVRASAARYVPTFERVIAAEGGTFVAGGNAPSYADFQLLFALDYASELLGEVAALGVAPLCAALRARLRSQPNMQAFYGARAKPLVTADYIREVRESQLPKGAEA
jgi:glutathione S-transferase